MRKNVWTFGLIAGAINALWLIGMVMSGREIDFDNGEILGFSAMIIAFSFIYVAIKNYRDKYNHGVITFGKAFQIGLYISLIASTCYVLTWLIEYNYFIPDFAERYAAHIIGSMEKAGAPAAEIESKVAEMKTFGEMYKNPFFNAALTYVEILPVGLLISVISSLILKKTATQQNEK